MFIVLLVLSVLVVAQATVIVLQSWDKSYGCMTRTSFDILYPLLRMLGYSFIMGDIDKFKAVNSTYGYQRANHLVNNSIRSFWRSGDMVFRYYSGDEFVVAIHGDVHAAAARLQQSFFTYGLSITVEASSTVSMGATLSSKTHSN